MYNHARDCARTGRARLMKNHKRTELTDIYMLKQLIKQANGFGAILRVIKCKKPEYDYYVSGKDTVGRQMKMAGTAEWLYNELLENLTNTANCREICD